jgi:hypothetical protein
MAVAGGLEAGRTYAVVGARFDGEGFDRFERRWEQVQRKARDTLTAHLDAHASDEGFSRWDKDYDQAQHKAHDTVTAKLDAHADTSGFDRYNRKVSDVNDGHRDLIRGSGRVRSALGTLFIGGAAVAGAGALAVGIGHVVGAFRESQRVARQTEAVLKSTGGAANVTAKDVANLAGALSQKTGIDDETIQSAKTSCSRSAISETRPARATTFSPRPPGP